MTYFTSCPHKHLLQTTQTGATHVACWLSDVQGNVVSGTAPGTVDSAVAVNPDGTFVEGPPDAQAQALDKEQAEMLLQVKPNRP
jgi:hypothetical protein